MRSCERCGEPCSRKGKRFCSHACWYAEAKHRPMCAWCESQPVRAWGRKFCCIDCANKHRGAQVAKPTMRQKCAWCQTLFTPGRKPSNAKPQRHCSRSCAQRALCITMDPAKRDAMIRRKLLKMNAAMARKREAAWDDRAAGMTPGQAARAFWFKGYHAGWTARRAGSKSLHKHGKAA